MGILNFLKKSSVIKEEELTPIAKTTWINVYYKILFKPKKIGIKNKLKSIF